MLQAIETTPQKYNSNTLANTPSSANASKVYATPTTTPTHTASNQSQSASAEEKQQRRRSTFYVPLVIEDDEDHREQPNDSSCSSSPAQAGGSAETSSLGGQSSASNTSSSTAQDLKSASSSSSSSNASGGKSKAEKNSNNNNLKKSISLKNASATSKVAALLFERTNSTLGLGGGTSSSNSTNPNSTASGVVKRSSAKKMSPPCGFSWTISGNAADTDVDDESDAAEMATATTVASKKAEKEKTKLSRLSQKPEKRHSTSSKSSVASSSATTASMQAVKQSPQKANTNAKTKRYGIVLNGISLDEENLHIAPATPITKSTPLKTRSNLVEFNEDDIVLATPTKQARNSRTATSTSKQTANQPKHGKRVGAWGRNDMHDCTDIDVGVDESSPHSDIDSDVNLNGGGGGDDDEDDDSEISRIQTNTSTPIKMMKSRSRTNILSVPSVEQHNLLSVAAAAAKPNASATPLLLRAKSKTLPQNLSPSVVLQQPEALYADCETAQTKTKASAGGTENTHTSRTSRLIGPLSKVHHNLFGGSVASHIGATGTTTTTNTGSANKNLSAAQHNKLAHSSSTSLITHTFPPKHLFLLKSTSKLPISNSSSLEHSKSKATKSFSSDSSITSPPTTLANASSAQPPQTVTSPPKKSLSFIRRAHSTKLSRNNSLLKSIASQHQQNIQQSAGNMAAGNGIVDCSGSWGKDFYLNYDVCPLALDELESYFRSERCTTLIRERFKILDIPLNCSAADELHNQQDSSLRELDTSCSSQQHLRMPGTSEASGGTAEEDDAGHHSGKLTNTTHRSFKNIRKYLHIFVTYFCTWGRFLLHNYIP
ncbi:PREDICTED: serine-rich adhesin for platelets-like [Rhagoletis zephyria]|uniref:serine-rich adhesin for platelets-like n=1 Tax=Rhagoletis zephyria TaxID=28612 RepID=UPI00081199C0|nr:PREDICTED: serine-rich adhesin for platelets-like [Rhagoletis zephyria]